MQRLPRSKWLPSPCSPGRMFHFETLLLGICWSAQHLVSLWGMAIDVLSRRIVSQFGGKIDRLFLQYHSFSSQDPTPLACMQPCFLAPPIPKFCMQFTDQMKEVSSTKGFVSVIPCLDIPRWLRRRSGKWEKHQQCFSSALLFSLWAHLRTLPWCTLDDWTKGSSDF